jgi:hypothetical protein
MYQAAWHNFLESVRAGARWAGGELIDNTELALVAGRRRWPVGYTNCAMRVDATVPAKEALARMRAFFGARDRGFTLFVCEPGDEDLLAETQGLTSLPPSPWMIAERPFAVPPGVTLRWCEDERALDEAVQICVDAYPSLSMPGEIVAAQFHERAALLREARVVIAEHDGAAASTALLLLTHDVAGIYWVGTRPSARGHRLAEACVAAAANAGLAAGARFVALQASTMGAPVYTRMGFLSPWQQRWVVVPR